MKIEISENEHKILIDILLDHNLCRSDCYMDYGDNIDCEDILEDGTYKCELENVSSSLLKKLGCEI